MIDVNGLLSKAIADDCIIGVTVVLRKEKVSKVNISALLIDKRDEKLNSRVINKSIIRLSLGRAITIIM